MASGGLVCLRTESDNAEARSSRRFAESRRVKSGKTVALEREQRMGHPQADTTGFGLCLVRETFGVEWKTLKELPSR